MMQAGVNHSFGPIKGANLLGKDYVWKDQQARSLSQVSPRWVTDLPLALLDTDFSLEYNPSTHGLCVVAAGSPSYLSSSNSPFQKQCLQCHEKINKPLYLVFATELMLSAVTLTFIFIHPSSIVLFLIRNLSNRSVHLRATRKSYFHSSLTAFP